MKLLVVEDEVAIRKVLTEQIRLKVKNITEARQAENGGVAVDMLDEFVPDILVTDIYMPIKNGIEVAHAVLQRNPDCKVIFISAYSDKEYLMEAIDINAVAYIEKPFDMKDVIQKVQHAVILICKQHYYFDMENVNKTRTIVDLLIKGNHCDDDRLKEQLTAFGLNDGSNMSHGIYNAVIFDFLSETDIDGKLYQINEMVKFDGCFGCISAEKNNHVGVVIFISSMVNVAYDIHEKQLLGYLSALKEKLGFESTNILIGKAVSKLSSVKLSYESAVMLMERAFLNGTDLVMSDTLHQFSPKEYTLSYNDIDLFEKYLTEKKQKECIDYINELAADIKNSNVLCAYIKEYFCRIRFVIERQMRTDNIFCDLERFGLKEIYEAKCFDDIIFLVNEMINYYFKCINTSVDAPIVEIVRFINDNISRNDLSLVVISENVGYAVSHICAIFKKKTGYTVNQYISLARIKKAKELLVSDNMSVKQIAESVGINDENYFYKFFKKHTGTSPKEYRNRGKL